MSIWAKEIEEYTTCDDFEEAEKQAMLDFIKRNPDNILLRDNMIAHMTASSWIMNSSLDKVLMVYHSIYNSWSWTGGHADGDSNFMQIAIREAKEETSIKSVEATYNKIFNLEILPVPQHIKRGKHVGNHLHLNLTYLLIADELETLHIKEDENSGVRWLIADELGDFVSEKEMMPLYNKLTLKARAK